MSFAGPRSVVEYVSGGPPLSEVMNGPAMADDLGCGQRHFQKLAGTLPEGILESGCWLSSTLR